MTEKSILTGLRLPEDLDARVRRIAARTGVPKNALLKIIIAGAVARHAEETHLTAEQLAAGEAVVASLRPRAAEKEKP